MSTHRFTGKPASRPVCGNTGMIPSSGTNRFIPFHRSDLIDMCLSDAPFSEPDRSAFKDFCRILESMFHFEFHRRLETLKRCYAPFNPDTDARRLKPYSEEEKTGLQQELKTSLRDLLNAANFEAITGADLEAALAEESLFEIRLKVDFDDFDDILFFRRGESVRQETLVRWFGLRRKPIRFTHFDRVLVYLKFKDQAYFDAAKRKQLYFKPGATVIKLFQNVPKADLEMLFPNTEVRMKSIDKLMIGIPAAVSGVAVVATKLGASLVLLGSLAAFWIGLSDREVVVSQQHLVGLGAGALALGAYLFKQVNKFKNRKLRFLKTLSDHLYFKNLDNNAGVLFHLIDAAEEEEFKEAVLAYFFLLTAEGPLLREDLDKRVESWLEGRWDCVVDFEVEDALAKLERFGLIRREGDRLSCLDLEGAKPALDAIWDGYFAFGPRGEVEPPR